MLCIIGSTAISYADGVIVPASIKLEAFKKDAKKQDFDLYGNDNSDGFIETNGNVWSRTY